MLIQFGNDHVYNPIVSDSGFRFFYFSQSIASNFIGSNHPSVYDLPCVKVKENIRQVKPP